MRKEIRTRLKIIGVGRLYLPQLVGRKPVAPHIPIIATPAKALRTRQRVVIVINDEFQDLGILSCQALEDEAGLKGGSVVALVEELLNSARSMSIGAEEAGTASDGVGENSSIPGLIVLNPGQLLYSHSRNEAMSTRAWRARNVASIAHPPVVMDKTNYVPGNETPEQHVAFVFNEVIANARFVHPDAELYIIGMQARGDLVLAYLNKNWSKWAQRIKAIALTEPRHLSSSITSGAFRTFLRDRGSAWLRSDAPVGAIIAVPDAVVEGQIVVHDTASESAKVMSSFHPEQLNDDAEHERSQASVHIDWCATLQQGTDEAAVDAIRKSFKRQSFGNVANNSDDADATDESISDDDMAAVTQPTYSAGDLRFGDSVFPALYRTILAWFENVARSPSTYTNPKIPPSEVWQPETMELPEEEFEHMKEVETRYAEGLNDNLTKEDQHPIPLVNAVVNQTMYTSGEADANAEHGAFVVKENLETPEDRVDE